MILLFTGAGGTGKTTLAKIAAEQYDLPFLKSSSREVQKQFGVEKEDDQLKMTPAELSVLQLAITERYWADAEKMALGPRGYVSDRTIADHFTYRVMKGWSEIDPEELATYERRISEQFRSADLVVHMPLGQFEPPADGFRTDDVVQREVFDRFLRGTIDRVRSEINHMSMTVSDLQTRVDHLHSALLNVKAIEPRDEREARLVRP